MPRRDFSKVPFAATGDTSSIPNATQPDGSVSLQQGWGFDYQRNNGAGGGTPDPLAKNIDRQVMNGVLNEITASVGEMQQNGFPIWVATAAPYPQNAMVRHNDIVWQSLAPNNNDTPGTTVYWKDVTTSYSGRFLRQTVFKVSGTFTSHPQAAVTMVEGCGGGGAGGSVSASGVNDAALGAASGGSSGNFARATYAGGITAGPVTIGAGGTPGVAGGATSFSGLLTLLGGPSAPNVTIVSGANNAGDNALQTSGPTGSGIIFGSSGQGGELAIAPRPSTICRSGAGGSTPYGSGGRGLANSLGGVAGFGYGSGGGGACNGIVSHPAQVGGNGAPGILIITEYS